MVGSPAISLHSWKQLAQWSLEYSCLSENKGKHQTRSVKSDKAQAQEMYLRLFESFCTTIEKNYGDLVDAEGYIVEDRVETRYNWPAPLDQDAEEARREAFFSAQRRARGN